ncbi:MAG: YdeI/OmpD-associated family protein [Vicinamibacterales bacterium]|nr:YdeI/OmpD-associated family protein [Vicinamibacterales bacterium]
MKTFLAVSLSEWRKWLSKHHASESEVWLVFFKQHTGETAIAYSDALDEALCFGWIDSLVKRLDDDRFARKFTPRKADSRWSEINRKRYAALKANGRIQPAGLKRPPTNRGYDPPPARRELPATLPDHIQQGLKQHPSARKVFDGLSPVHRRRYVAWVDSAKREETKARRLAEAIRLLTAGQPLGLK